MSSHYNIPDLNRFSIHQNIIFSCIASPGLFSDHKITFDKKYILNIPKIIEIDFEGHLDKRKLNWNKDFNNNTYINFKKLDYASGNSIILPLFENCEFLCVNCNKLYKRDSDQCCSLSSGIIVNKADLSKLYIPKVSEINNSIKIIKNKFTSLHFPDLFDKIMMK
jgi:hypothetical protein